MSAWLTEKSVYKIEDDEVTLTPAFGGALKRNETSSSPYKKI
jgi:hypothetical protein